MKKLTNKSRINLYHIRFTIGNHIMLDLIKASDNAFSVEVNQQISKNTRQAYLRWYRPLFLAVRFRTEQI